MKGNQGFCVKSSLNFLQCVRSRLWQPFLGSMTLPREKVFRQEPIGTGRSQKKMGTGRYGSKKYRHSEFLGAAYSGPMDLWVSQVIQGIIFFGFQLVTISSSFNILRQKIYFLIPQLSQTCKLVMKKQGWSVCS